MIYVQYFLFVVLLCIIFFNKKVYIYSLVLLIVALNPVVEKLSDKTMYETGWMNVNFTRAWPELLLVLILLLVYIASKQSKLFHFENDKSLFHSKFFFVIWFLFSLVAVPSSADPNRSVYLFILAFIGPPLFCRLLIRYYYPYLTNVSFEQIILKQISYSVILFVTVGLIVFYQTGGLESIAGLDLNDTRSKQLLWLGNHGIQCTIMFLPFLLLQKGMVKYIAIAFFTASLLIGVSRTNFVVVVVTVTIMSYWKFKLKYILYAYITGLVLFSLFSVFFTNYAGFLLDRFLGDSSSVITEQITDQRVGIWKTALKIFFDHPWFGSGEGTFYLFNIDKYSDAHNIFFSILCETGMISFLAFIGFLISLFYWPKFEYSKYFKLGLLAFLVNGFTGNQLFNNSGFVTGLMAYFFFAFLAVYELFYLRSKLEISN